MRELHDWHVTAYTLAVHERIDTCRIREVDGVFIMDNDPQKEAEWDRLETKNKIMRARLKEQEREAWVEHDERVDAKLQAALSPPPPPLVEPALPIAATATPAPMVTVGASGGVEPDKAGPLPLTTGDIAFCFAGLKWDEQQWKKPLGDKPKWLAACLVIPGARGVSETRWNPVLIGAALERDGHAKQNSIRAKFQTQPQLAPWLDAWKTYEADNLST